MLDKHSVNQYFWQLFLYQIIYTLFGAAIEYDTARV
jgi:uncharacterized membrane protein HdeD (DUF308 family)